MTHKKKHRTKSKLSSRSKDKLKPMTKEELTQVIQKFKHQANDKPRNSKPNIAQETKDENSDSELILKPLKTMPISEASSQSKLDSSKDLYLSESLILYEEEHKKTVKPEKPGKTGDSESSLPKEESSFFITYASEHNPAENPPASTQVEVAEDLAKKDSIVEEEVYSEEYE